LGLVVGFAVVQIIEKIFSIGSCFDDKRTKGSGRAGMYSLPPSKEDDPGAVALDFREALFQGACTKAQADKLFNAPVDWDQSDTIKKNELSDYMLNPGLSLDQVEKLYTHMDADKNGEVSLEEFCRVILDKNNAALLKPVDKEAAADVNYVGVDIKQQDTVDSDEKEGH